MFIATANQLETIQPALLDRMEVIDLSGYSIEEKVHIAERYLIPKQIVENGVPAGSITFDRDLLEKIVMQYTMESGVRSLERSIGSICRTVAYQYAIKKDKEGFSVKVDKVLVEEALGVPKFDDLLKEKITRPGIAIGLAYTTYGGKVLLIETSKFPGSGQIKLTGKLGDVMKESVTTGLSWIRANSTRLGITSDPKSNSDVFVEETDIH
jgi:ATP-dependent Lon protease